MAYVRQRGKQLALVHGVRDPQTKKVEQEILFTLYSRPEALAAISKEKGGHFRHLLEERHPQLRFDWKAIRAAVEQHLPTLPESWDYRAPKLRGEFGEDLGRFARQLALAEPARLAADPERLAQFRLQLGYLKELIQRRLTDTGEDEDPQLRERDEFGWYARSNASEVPPELEGQAAAWYERRDYPRAIGAFTVLTQAFPDYAEGHNYLGLMALENKQLEQAIAHFKRTMEVGRRLFPRRIAKNRWWTDLATRPYMRGLRNLALALNQAGRWDEALGACEQLQRQCHDDITAAAHRATAYLNLGQWQPALEAAKFIQQISPGQSLVAAFAGFELGRLDEARGWFLHVALHLPRTVAMVLGLKSPPMPAKPGYEEVEDNNGGINEARSLQGFFRRQSGPSRRFFTELWRSQKVTQLREELAEVSRRSQQPSKVLDRAAFDRMSKLRSYEFAMAAMAPPSAPALQLMAGRTRSRRGEVH